jgi:hypothetical protein
MRLGDGAGAPIMLVFVTVLSLLGSASVLVGAGANLGRALAAPAAAFQRGSSAAMGQWLNAFPVPAVWRQNLHN